MAGTLDIVIVNWNSGSQLRECLGTIVDANDGGIALDRVVVVDNHSSDRSEEGLDEFNLPLVLIRNAENRGFAAACNQGAWGSKADYLLFLNPDTRLLPDSLSAPISFLDNDSERRIGICGIQLLDEEGGVARSCARFPTLSAFAYRMIGLDKLNPERFHGLLMHDWDHMESGVVDHVIGAFFLVRSDVFVRLNGFDERFFVYLEDLDFSLRASNIGCKSYYLADVSAYHMGGGSSRQVKAKRLFYSLRSRIQYAFKHFSRRDALLLLLMTLTIEPISLILWNCIRFSARGVGESVHGFILFYLSLPKLLSLLWESRGELEIRRR